MGEFITEKECKAFQQTIMVEIAANRRVIEANGKAIDKLTAAIDDFTKQIQAKTERNGQQNVEIERLSGRIAALEKEDRKKHDWVLYLFLGGLTLLNVGATAFNCFK